MVDPSVIVRTLGSTAVTTAPGRPSCNNLLAAAGIRAADDGPAGRGAHVEPLGVCR